MIFKIKDFKNSRTAGKPDKCARGVFFFKGCTSREHDVDVLDLLQPNIVCMMYEDKQIFITCVHLPGKMSSILMRWILHNYPNPSHIEAQTKWPLFRDNIFKCIFLNENVWIFNKISLKFVPEAPSNTIPALVQVMAWRWSGDKPLSQPMMVRWPLHICINRVRYLVWNFKGYVWNCTQKFAHTMSCNFYTTLKFYVWYIIIIINNQCWNIINWTLRNKLQWNLIEIHTFSFMKMHLKMLSGKCRPFCLGLDVLILASCCLPLTLKEQSRAALSTGSGNRFLSVFHKDRVWENKGPLVRNEYKCHLNEWNFINIYYASWE